MLINTSITRSKGQFSQSFEPPLSLEEQRIRKGDRVMLLALASGIEIGIAIFTVDSMVDRYGNSH